MDLSKFHETFFQESLEGIGVMEAGLLALSAAVGGQEDPEVIHNVFRAAHSIKGGSATFGFADIAEFTHLLETILDLMREGGATPTPLMTDVLLQAVDWLRELINARMEGRKPDQDLMHRATADLATMLAQVNMGDEEAPAPTAKKPAAATAAAESPQSNVHSPADSAARPALRIGFNPHSNLLRSGNDPFLYLNELDKLGRLTNKANIDKIPPLGAMDTEACYISYEATLRDSYIAAPQIKEIFEWIADDCDLDIKELAEEKQAGVAAVAGGAKAEVAQSAAKEGGSIRVATKKIDALVNLIGELVITQSMLTCIGDEFDVSQLEKLKHGITQLTRNTRELQETVLQIRMLPISNLFERLPRLIHDLNRRLGKLVRLEVSGGQTELDKTVLEKLGDPMVHLVRNSMDHGIERPETRREVGKPDEGVLRLHAEHRGGNIVIEISDDGAGLNEQRILARAKERGLVGANDTLTPSEIHLLIFAPGFSTAAEVTDVSGRGVGMDVVRRNVEDLGGRIDISSRTGMGTTISIQLPLTLAIMEGQLLQVGGQRFVVPLVSIVESLRVDRAALHKVAGELELYQLRDEYLPVLHLEKVFRLDSKPRPAYEGLLVVVESRGKRSAIRVDDLLAQQQVVVKSLEANLFKVAGIAGATILGDGNIAMILDVAGVAELARSSSGRSECEYPPFEAWAPKEGGYTNERVN